VKRRGLPQIVLPLGIRTAAERRYSAFLRGDFTPIRRKRGRRAVAQTEGLTWMRADGEERECPHQLSEERSELDRLLTAREFLSADAVALGEWMRREAKALRWAITILCLLGMLVAWLWR
jgi:hypothetical protein